MILNSVSGISPFIPSQILEKPYQEFIESCLVCDPSHRPSAEGLQYHHFFEEVWRKKKRKRKSENRFDKIK